MSEKRKGLCPVCGRRITVNKDETLRQHGTKEPGVWPPMNCPGWGMVPAKDEVAS